jgi:hypothetical protein
VEDGRQKIQAEVLADKRRRLDKSQRHPASVAKRQQCQSMIGRGVGKEEEEAWRMEVEEEIFLFLR